MTKRRDPKPVDPSELPRLARAVIEADRLPFLATVDQDRPRLRPVSPVRTDGFTVYVASLRSYHKTGEIAANPRVELAYLSADHDQVRISGRAEAVTEQGLLREIWDANPLLRHYLGTPENLELIVYRIVPERVRFMREWSVEYHEVPLDAGRQERSSGATHDAAGAHDRGSRFGHRRRTGRHPDHRSSAEPALADSDTEPDLALATRRHRLGADRHARQQHQVRGRAAPETLPVADGLRAGHGGLRRFERRRRRLS